MKILFKFNDDSREKKENISRVVVAVSHSAVVNIFTIQNII